MKIKSYEEAVRIVNENKREITKLVDEGYDIKEITKKQLDMIILYYALNYAETLYMARGERERTEILRKDIEERKKLSKKEIDKHIEMCNSIIAKCNNDESDNRESEK